MKRNIKWAYLAVGFVILIFSNGRYSTTVGPWIAPIFIIGYTRKEKLLRGYLISSIIIGAALQITFWGFSSRNPHSLLFYLPFTLGFIISIPYTADRILRGSFNGIWRTIIFPAAYTTVEFIYINLSPLGSTGSLAYTQTGFTPLLQIASITGIYGITFLITWFGATVSEIKYLVNENEVLKSGFIYALVLIVVLGFGEIRLLLPEHSKTVRVSGFNAYDFRSKYVQETWDMVAKDKNSFKILCDDIINKLILRTKKEAQAGSKIIVWPEISPLMLNEDKENYINKIRQAAKEEKIYLVTSPYILSKDLKEKDYNLLMVFNPKGELILEHTKYGGAMFDNIVKGDEIIKAVSTEYGKISGIICWDADFPDIVRQEGKLKTDILFTSAADWKEIDPIHSAPALLRGIENGMSVLRQTANGLSFASDSKGRYIVKMDHYTSGDWSMVAQMPTKGSICLYPYIGDLFAVINTILFIISVLFHIKIEYTVQ